MAKDTEDFEQDVIFVSVEEAAHMLGLSKNGIAQLLDSRAIDSRYSGRRRLVDLESIRAYAKSLPTEPPPRKKADAPSAARKRTATPRKQVGHS